MQSSFTEKQLDRRAATILRGVRTRQVAPGSDAIVELAELTETLSDQPVKPIVVARLTITRAVGCRTIIEVCEDATFNAFYRIHTQDGNRRSTKRLVRTSNRNEGISSWMPAHRMTPGLELLAARWTSHPGVTAVTVRILRKRAYKRLISASPDVLGLTKTAPFILRHPFARHS